MLLKWIFDRVGALCALFLLWPLLLVVAVLIKVMMPGGPVIFRQQRVGKGGRLFTCHKFRTMMVKHHGSTVSVAGDARITPLGAKLRRYKIDELPGLWDVLIGKMSMVGPRPDVPGYADRLEGRDRDVLRLLPGITGPATLKYRMEEEMISDCMKRIRRGHFNSMKEIGWRREDCPDFSNMTNHNLAHWLNDHVIYPDKVRINCYYARNYSFLKDIQIIMATILGQRIWYNGEWI